MNNYDMNTVNVYNISVDGNKQLTDHFKVCEFACKDGSNVVLVHPACPEFCELARTINGPFSPNSAYRTVTHNSREGGASSSNHIFGRAVDIPACKATPAQLYELFDKTYPDNMELGIYSWGVHIAYQTTKNRFRG